MSGVEIGKTAPGFSIASTGGERVKLSDFTGKKNVVLYFYPKDNTPGCTTEGQDFRDRYDEFAKLDAVILGVSRDSLKSHENFKAKHDFPFDLLSDPDEELCKLYDVIKMKNMYGKKVRGVERSTFLIDKKGVMRREWRKVKVSGHADAVLDALAELQDAAK